MIARHYLEHALGLAAVDGRDLAVERQIVVTVFPTRGGDADATVLLDFPATARLDFQPDQFQDPIPLNNLVN